MKTKLRQKYKTLRANLSLTQINDLSLKIYKNVVNNFELNHQNVSIFIPIEKFNEVNTWYFLNNNTANFYLPVVKNKTLIHIKYENKQQLQLSDWGILEPTFGETSQPAKFDIVIVPLLAYDKQGNRIGYGAGFYDGFLKYCNPNCKFVGVSFFEPENSIIETYPTDIPLHYCITPQGIIEF